AMNPGASPYLKLITKNCELVDVVLLPMRRGIRPDKDEHQRPGADEGTTSRLRAANSMTAWIWPRSSPSNHSIMSSILAPACRFSKMTETGIRVPRSTQAPLTFPGMLSTAGHWDQSSAGIQHLFSNHRTPVCEIRKRSKTPGLITRAFRLTEN